MRLFPNIGFGTELYPERVARRLRVLNVTVWCSALLTSGPSCHRATRPLQKRLRQWRSDLGCICSRSRSLRISACSSKQCKTSQAVALPPFRSTSVGSGASPPRNTAPVSCCSRVNRRPRRLRPSARMSTR